MFTNEIEWLTALHETAFASFHSKWLKKDTRTVTSTFIFIADKVFGFPVASLNGTALAVSRYNLLTTYCMVLICVQEQYSHVLMEIILCFCNDHAWTWKVRNVNHGFCAKKKCFDSHPQKWNKSTSHNLYHLSSPSLLLEDYPLTSLKGDK